MIPKPSIADRAYQRWLEFSRAGEIERVNLVAGRNAPSAWNRWDKMVSWKVKQQFMDEVRYE